MARSDDSQSVDFPPRPGGSQCDPDAASHHDPMALLERQRQQMVAGASHQRGAKRHSVGSTISSVDEEATKRAKISKAKKDLVSKVSCLDASDFDLGASNFWGSRDHTYVIHIWKKNRGGRGRAMSPR